MTEIWQSPHWPNFGYDAQEIEPILERLATGVGQVRGLYAGMSPADREQILLREIAQEAVHSFGIEGVTLDADEIQASVAASMAGRNLTGATRRSDRVAALMLAARDPNTVLDEATLCTWHRLLFDGTPTEDIGRWRSTDMVIVKSARADREEILYKAPDAALVAGAMATWARAAAAGQTTSTPVFAALMHLWFESIHPFSDGNGRIGRAIVETIFARAGGLPFSLSRQIEADKQGYYDALQAGRRQGAGRINGTAFVVWFLESIEKAAMRGLAEAEFLTRRNQFFLRHATHMSARQTKVMQMLFAHGSARVDLGISNKSYIKMANVSEATATRDLGALARAGVLTKGQGGGRSTVYYLA